MDAFCGGWLMVGGLTTGDTSLGGVASVGDLHNRKVACEWCQVQRGVPLPFPGNLLSNTSTADKANQQTVYMIF